MGEDLLGLNDATRSITGRHNVPNSQEQGTKHIVETEVTDAPKDTPLREEAAQPDTFSQSLKPPSLGNLDPLSRSNDVSPAEKKYVVKANSAARQESVSEVFKHGDAVGDQFQSNFHEELYTEHMINIALNPETEDNPGGGLGDINIG